MAGLNKEIVRRRWTSTRGSRTRDHKRNSIHEASSIELGLETNWPSNSFIKRQFPLIGPLTLVCLAHGRYIVPHRADEQFVVNIYISMDNIDGKRDRRSAVVPRSGQSGQTGNGTYVTVSGTILGPLRTSSTKLNTISRFPILCFLARVPTYRNAMECIKFPEFLDRYFYIKVSKRLLIFVIFQ